MTAVELKDKTRQWPQNGSGDPSFAELLEEYEYPAPRRGQILQGEVLHIEDDTLLLDVGAKRDAIVPQKEINQLDDRLLDTISTGDQVPVYVTRTPVGDEYLLVSLEKGLEQQDWQRAEQYMADEETVSLEVTGHNKGGLIVAFGRLSGFVPNSHIPDLRHIQDHSQRVSFKSKCVGATMPLKIIEIDRSRRRLVLSAAAAQQERRQRFLHQLKEGQIVKGQVDHIVDYGAFIKLGPVSGLLHISKIAWEHVDHPSEFLSVDDEVEVIVDQVDVEQERISLDRKSLLPSPWQEAAEQLSAGDLVAGEVTAVRDFGAFVKLPMGIEGLIHASEMHSAGREKPQAVLQPGDPVLVRVVNIQPERERLGLSMRRVSAAEEIEWMATRQS